METIDGNAITTETLTGVSSSFPPTDDSHKILKPSSEGTGGEKLPPENEVLGGGGGGDAEKRSGEDFWPENELSSGGGAAEEKGGEDLVPENDVLGGGGGATVVVTTTVIEKTEISMVQMIQEDKKEDDLKNKEDEEKGYFGNLAGDVDENTMFGDAKGSHSSENGSETKSGGDLIEVEKCENGAEIVESVKDMSIENDEKKPINVQKSESESGFQENCQDSGRALPENEGDFAKIVELGEQNVWEKNPENVDNSDPKSEIQENSRDSGKEFPKNEGDYPKIIESGEQDVGEKKVENPENVDNSDPTSEIQENGQDSGRELPENEGEDDETEDHDFVVGDFVWGKIKSHPWWPGQIYDPSDASDYAVTLKRKNHLLVAYFGDGSFSWCSPSQLKPFIESFNEMSTQSDSKKFVNAVQKALEAVGKLVEAEMMCKCRTFDREFGGGDVAANSGIKAGVGMPKGNTIKILIDRMNPIELFSILKASATMDPGVKTAELELTVLKSCLSAFYRRKGSQLLPEYRDAEFIEGLEDGSRSGFVSDSDKNGPSESGDGKLNKKRKQKSVAELLGEDEPKIKKVKTSGGSSVKKERKRKALVVSVTPESDHDSGGGGGGEETMSPRQRKKSKYLSPPYLSPIWTGKLSGSGSFKVMKTESAEKVPEMAAKHLEDSLKRGRRSNHHRGLPGGDFVSQEDEKTAEVNVNEVLDGLLRAALDPAGFVEKKKKKKVPEVSEFISAFRSSVFEEEEKKPGSELEFIERKLVAIREMVKGCGEGEMSEEMKGNLEEGLKEVLEKVGEMK